jgi:sugar phosphate isomerase/epimerase
MRAALAESGVVLGLLEGFTIAPESCAEDHLRDLDLVAKLDGRAICTVSLERDMARTHAEFARLTELAADRGLVTTTEVGAGVLRRLDKAALALAAVADPAFKLLIDTMHFFRFGGTVADLAALEPASIGHVQLNDVPMPAIIENYMEEALYERRAPGDGDLPLLSSFDTFPTASWSGSRYRSVRKPSAASARANASPGAWRRRGR